MSEASVQAYLRYLDTPRGRLRAALERRSLLAALASPRGWQALRVLDAGCGPRPISLELTGRVQELTLLDSDPAALEHARTLAASLLPTASGALYEVVGTLEMLASTACYDVVICHHVLEFAADPAAALQAAARSLAPSGLLSIVVPNAAGMALQSYARDGDPHEALRGLERGTARPGLCGETRRAYEARALLRDLRALGLRARLAAGIMVLAPLRPDSDNDATLEEHEWRLARRQPFREVGRHLHVVAWRPG